MPSTPLLNANNVVVNMVELESETTWEPPEGLIIGALGGRIGWIWNGTDYIDPDPPAPPNAEPEANGNPTVIE